MNKKRQDEFQVTLIDESRKFNVSSNEYEEISLNRENFYRHLDYLTFQKPLRSTQIKT